MADASSRAVNDTISLRLIISCGILNGIMFLMYCARMFSRLYPHRKLAWDDYTVSIAAVFSLVAYGLQVVACTHGMGRHYYYVSVEDRSIALLCMFVNSYFWFCGIACMRISVGLLLLRLKDSWSRSWAWTIWTIIVIQVISTVASVILQLLVCRPIRLQWEVVPDGVCWSPLALQVWGYLYSAPSILSEFVFSLMPLSFIWRLNRPLLERVVVGILMTLGLFTTSIAIVKTSYMALYSHSEDALRHFLTISMWCELELVVGIIAGCIPCLKSPFQRILRRWQLLPSKSHLDNDQVFKHYHSTVVGKYQGGE
ncbi:hypothetical protein BKA66DRAFT_584714 [Pyrenochaeta sp. MPI-SDFR-AT-0127]|nr:hypothetical protein BKA66DRAFT_584714 [Pyrenochaeta sp. MPI-SDFR-AT-0127]